MFYQEFQNKRILITGHTGFKGTWLAALLSVVGAEVCGISDSKDYFLHQQVSKELPIFSESISDIREYVALEKYVTSINPDYIFHFAAQPLVVNSYKSPLMTFETNIIGTLNLLEIIRTNALNPKNCVIVTTDKVYKNSGRDIEVNFRENDMLGGSDPYSASKSAADILAQAYMSSFEKMSCISIARSGNVIGGGDRAENRIITDIINAVSSNSTLQIRNPKATRPWLHVLDSLNGYLAIAQTTNSGSESIYNLAPNRPEVMNVEDIVHFAMEKHFPMLQTAFSLQETIYPEKQYLSLDASRASTELNWKPKLSTENALAWTFDFESKILSGHSAKKVLIEQLNQYLEMF